MRSEVISLIEYLIDKHLDFEVNTNDSLVEIRITSNYIDKELLNELVERGVKLQKGYLTFIERWEQ